MVGSGEPVGSMGRVRGQARSIGEGGSGGIGGVCEGIRWAKGVHGGIGGIRVSLPYPPGPGAMFSTHFPLILLTSR